MNLHLKLQHLLVKTHNDVVDAFLFWFLIIMIFYGIWAYVFGPSMIALVIFIVLGIGPCYLVGKMHVQYANDFRELEAWLDATEKVSAKDQRMAITPLCDVLHPSRSSAVFTRLFSVELHYRAFFLRFEAILEKTIQEAKKFKDTRLIELVSTIRLQTEKLSYIADPGITEQVVLFKLKDYYNRFIIGEIKIRREALRKELGQTISLTTYAESLLSEYDALALDYSLFEKRVNEMIDRESEESIARLMSRYQWQDKQVGFVFRILCQKFPHFAPKNYSNFAVVG